MSAGRAHGTPVNITRRSSSFVSAWPLAGQCTPPLATRGRRAIHHVGGLPGCSSPLLRRRLVLVVLETRLAVEDTVRFKKCCKKHYRDYQHVHCRYQKVNPSTLPHTPCSLQTKPAHSQAILLSILSPLRCCPHHRLLSAVEMKVTRFHDGVKRK